MPRRIAFAIATVVVVTAAIVLVLKLRSSDPASSTPDPARTPREDRSASSARSEPRLPSTPSEAGSSTTTPTGDKIRDHRDTPMPYEGRDAERTQARLPPTLVRAISKQLEAQMVECTRAIPAEARAKAKVTGSVFVDVAAGTLTVTEAAVELTGVTGDAATAKQCMQTNWVGQSTSADDAVSASHYEISVVFSVPSR
jgi:hypothetical protein